MNGFLLIIAYGIVVALVLFWGVFSPVQAAD
jgi:hypothetical protein